MRITYYENKTCSDAVILTSNGRELRVEPYCFEKAEEGECFLKIKYPNTPFNRWRKF